MADGLLDTQPVPPIASYTPAQAAPAPATSTGYTPTPYTSTGYQATPYAVPDSGLVQNQVKDIVGQDSPLMEQAKTRAAQTMQSRGLLNSALAIQAGQEGVISSALPIAQAD